MMHDSRLNQKAITLGSGPADIRFESQSPFLSLLRRYPFFASATLHGGAIHRINKSLLPLLNVCTSRLKFSARGIVGIPSSQLSLRARARFCILVSVSSFRARFLAADRQSAE